MRFLTKTRKGHCEYFASSLALLSRMAGVPSRYVTGYAAVERNKFGGYLMARDSDAHAWTETYFEGEGWTVWDPTPSGWQHQNRSLLYARGHQRFFPRTTNSDNDNGTGVHHAGHCGRELCSRRLLSVNLSQ